MKVRVEGIRKEKDAYNERGLQYSISRKRLYPSKKMFVDFLKQYSDVRGNAEIWATDTVDGGNVTTTINVELTFKIPNLPRKKGKKRV